MIKHVGKIVKYEIQKIRFFITIAMPLRYFKVLDLCVAE